MITVNIAKAREVGHALRRQARQAELAPLDARINHAMADAATVTAVEAERQAIRDKYAAMQRAIDAAETPDAIRAALAG